MGRKKGRSLQRQREEAHAIHVKERLLHRYGIIASTEDVDDLAERFRSGDNGRLIRNEPKKHRQVRDVQWKGKTIRVVYDKRVRYPVTVLPRGRKHSKKLGPAAFRPKGR